MLAPQQQPALSDDEEFPSLGGPDPTFAASAARSAAANGTASHLLAPNVEAASADADQQAPQQVQSHVARQFCHTGGAQGGRCIVAGATVARSLASADILLQQHYFLTEHAARSCLRSPTDAVS